jgi:hypothetical protein
MADRKFETVSDVLNRVVRTLEIERDLLAHAVGSVWSRTVGERLAAHTRAAQLRGGVLTVEARSAAWLNETSLLREQIRERLNAELRGTVVREVKFRLGGGFPPLGGEVRRGIDLRPTEEEIERARAELSAESTEGADLAARALALSRKREALG